MYDEISFYEAAKAVLATPAAPTKTITIREFIDAIEKNGYEQIFGDLFDPTEVNPRADQIDTSKITKACALGQGMLNLNVRYVYLDESASSTIFRDFLKSVSRRNDLDHLEPAVIAAQVREEFKELLDTSLRAYEFGDDISGVYPQYVSRT